MATAKEVYDKLVSLGHDYNPHKAVYKGEVAGTTVTLYDPVNVDRDGKAKAVEVRAENVEHYVDKGFLFEQGKKIGPSEADREKAAHEAATADARAGLVAAAQALNALAEESVPEAEDEAPMLEKMTKAELEAEAERLGVDISEAHNNDERRELIAAERRELIAAAAEE